MSESFAMNALKFCYKWLVEEILYFGPRHLIKNLTQLSIEADGPMSMPYVYFIKKKIVKGRAITVRLTIFFKKNH